MFFRRLIWALIFFFVLALAGTAQQGKGWEKVPPPSPEVQRGQKVFVANCSFCHGPDGSGQDWS